MANGMILLEFDLFLQQGLKCVCQVKFVSMINTKYQQQKQCTEGIHDVKKGPKPNIYNIVNK